MKTTTLFRVVSCRVGLAALLVASQTLVHAAGPLVVTGPSNQPLTPLPSAVAWGSNLTGESDLPYGLHGVIGVAADSSSSALLMKDGTIGLYPGPTAPHFVPASVRQVTAVAAGYSFYAALRSNGTVVTFPQGAGPYGEISTRLRGIKAIAAGTDFVAALRVDGRVFTWGDSYAQFLLKGLGQVRAIAAGGHALVVVKTTGQVQVYGFETESMVPPAGLSDVVSVATGGNHVLAVKKDGSVVAWGSGSAVTGMPPNLRDVKSVAANAGASLALKTDGSVVAWGELPRNTEATVAKLRDVTAITLGPDHALAVCALPARYDFGSVLEGESGAAQTFNVRNTGKRPITLTSFEFLGQAYEDFIIDNPPTNALTLAPGASWALSMRFKPTSWGKRSARLTITTDGAAPYQLDVSGHGEWATPSVVVKRADGVSITPQHDLRFWGQTKDYGFMPPANLTKARQVEMFETSALVLNEDGSVTDYRDRQKTIGIAALPMPKDLKPVHSIALGSHVLALEMNGTVRAWGRNVAGQADVPADLHDVIAIDAGWSHSLALRRNGTVVAWGENQYGQSDVPAGLNQVKSIAANGHRSMAMRHDGTVVFWGEGAATTDYTVPPSLTQVKGIATGLTHSSALQQDGTVVAWGSDFGSQLNVPSGLLHARSVVCGDFHSYALLPSGKVWSWGSLRYRAGTTLSYGDVTVPEDLTDVHRLFTSNRGVTSAALVRTTAPVYCGSAPPSMVTNPISLKLSNVGRGRLDIESITFIGANPEDFNLAAGWRDELAPGANLALEISFAPKAEGLRSAVLVIQSNDRLRPSFEIPVQGTGVCPSVAIHPPQTSTMKRGTSGSLSFTHYSNVTTPRSFRIAQGRLPNGIILAGDGTLSGTPDESGDFRIEVELVDSYGCVTVSNQWTFFVTDQVLPEDTLAQALHFHVPPGVTFTTEIYLNHRLAPLMGLSVTGEAPDYTIQLPQPPKNFNGVIVIKVKRSDGVEQKMALEYTPVNDAPFAKSSTITTGVDVSPASVVTAFNFNDLDEGDTVTYSIAADRPEALAAGSGIHPKTGQLTLVSPNDGSTNGPVVVKVIATDLAGESATADVVFNPSPILPPQVSFNRRSTAYNEAQGIYDMELKVQNPNRYPVDNFAITVGNLAPQIVLSSVLSGQATKNANGDSVLEYRRTLEPNETTTWMLNLRSAERVSAAFTPTLTSALADPYSFAPLHFLPQRIPNLVSVSYIKWPIESLRGVSLRTETGSVLRCFFRDRPGYLRPMRGFIFHPSTLYFSWYDEGPPFTLPLPVPSTNRSILMQRTR